MELSVLNSNVKLSILDKVFNVSYNKNLINQVLVSVRNNYRKFTSKQKSRSEVSGSNKKPWRQKGTGRARAGTTSSPIWRSGGVTFAANISNRRFLKVNKKMYKKAIKILLSNYIKKSNLYVLEKIIFNSFKTKDFLHYFNFVNEYKCLLVLCNRNNNIYLSSRNLYNFNVCLVDNIKFIDLFNHKSIVFTINSIKKLEEKLI